MRTDVKKLLEQAEKDRIKVTDQPSLYPLAYDKMDSMVWDEIVDNFTPDKLAFTDITQGGVIKLYLNEKVPAEYYEYLRLHEFGHILFGHTKENVEELHYEQLKRKCYHNWDKIAEHIDFEDSDKNLTKIELANKYIVPLSELFLSYAEDFEVNSKLFSEDEWDINTDLMDYADIITSLKSAPSATDTKNYTQAEQKQFDAFLADIKDWLSLPKEERRHWCHPLWPEDYDMPPQLSCPEYIDLIFAHLDKFMNFVRQEAQNQRDKAQSNKNQQQNNQNSQNSQQGQNGSQQNNSQTQNGQQSGQQSQNQQGQNQNQRGNGQQNGQSQPGQGQSGQGNGNGQGQNGNQPGPNSNQSHMPWEGNNPNADPENTQYEKPTESGGGKGNTGTGKRPSLREKKQQQQAQGQGQGNGQNNPLAQAINSSMKKLSLDDIEKLRKQANRDDTNKGSNASAASGSHNQASGGNNQAVSADSGGGEWSGQEGLGFGHAEVKRPDVIPLGDGKQLARYIERESFSKKIENSHANIMYYYNRRKYGKIDVVTKETRENIYRPGNIYVVVDCSGSIDERAIKKMLNVIKQLSKKCGPKSRVIWWDTRLCKDVLLREPQEPVCGGGTDIAEGIKYVREKYLKNSNDKLFIISDYYDSLAKWYKEAEHIRNEINGICWTQDKSIKSAEEFVKNCNYGSNFNVKEFLKKIKTKIILVD